MAENQLIPHLFRSEFAKIVAVLCKTYGIENVQLAEDFASETFLKAAETWGIKGVPENPTAWLYIVAKNKAKDYFKHTGIFAQKIRPNLEQQQLGADVNTDWEIDLSEDNIQDSQLQMIFAVCNPVLANEAQIAMALRVLCGFGVDEIANALLSNKATINKRLFRAKEKFRSEKIELKFPAPHEIEGRMENVLAVLYLLYNEGYYSTTVAQAIRKDLCFEAMRLLLILINNKATFFPPAAALMALFCFHASRFDARTDDQGQVVLYDDQDQTKWSLDLIQKGEYYLNLSAKGSVLSKYHLEASIAFWHTQVEVDEERKWKAILQLYNRLLQVEYSPVAALNRTYALSRAEGKEKALNEALKINLDQNHLYHILLAGFYADLDPEKELIHLNRALTLAPNEQTKRHILKKIDKFST